MNSIIKRFGLGKLLLSIVAIIFLSLVVFVGISYILEDSANVTDVYVTNVTGTSATVVWVTEEPSRGRVVYGTEDNWVPLLNYVGKQWAYDDRDAEEVNYNEYALKDWGNYYTHHVTLTGLEPNTRYFYKISTGLKSVEFEYPIIETNDIVESPYTPDPMYGLVQDATGNGIADGVVMYTVKNGAQSQVYSTPLNDTGGWSGDIGYVMTGEGEKIEIDMKSDVKLSIVTSHGSRTKTFNLEDHQPLPTVTITGLEGDSSGIVPIYEPQDVEFPEVQSALPKSLVQSVHAVGYGGGACLSFAAPGSVHCNILDCNDYRCEAGSGVWSDPLGRGMCAFHPECVGKPTVEYPTAPPVRCGGFAFPGEAHCNTDSCQQYTCSGTGSWNGPQGKGVCAQHPDCQPTAGGGGGGGGVLPQEGETCFDQAFEIFGDFSARCPGYTPNLGYKQYCTDGAGSSTLANCGDPIAAAFRIDVPSSGTPTTMAEYFCGIEGWEFGALIDNGYNCDIDGGEPIGDDPGDIDPPVDPGGGAISCPAQNGFEVVPTNNKSFYSKFNLPAGTSGEVKRITDIHGRDVSCTFECNNAGQWRHSSCAHNERNHTGSTVENEIEAMYPFVEIINTPLDVVDILSCGRQFQFSENDLRALKTGLGEIPQRYKDFLPGTAQLLVYPTPCSKFSKYYGATYAWTTEVMFNTNFSVFFDQHMGFFWTHELTQVYNTRTFGFRTIDPAWKAAVDNTTPYNGRKTVTEYPLGYDLGSDLYYQEALADAVAYYYEPDGLLSNAQFNTDIGSLSPAQVWALFPLQRDYIQANIGGSFETSAVPNANDVYAQSPADSNVLGISDSQFDGLEITARPISGFGEKGIQFSSTVEAPHENHEVFVNGSSAFSFIREQGEGQVVFEVFTDVNGNSTYDEGVDRIYSIDKNAISISEVSDSITWSLDVGWNLMAFPLVMQGDDTSEIDTASELIQTIRDNGGLAKHVATFRNGKWLLYSERANISFSNDFHIVPGAGYFVKNYKAISLKLRGKTILDPIPLEFSSGWNMVGIFSPSTDYTSESLVNGIVEKGITADVVTQWKGGRYENFVKEGDITYGNGFAIIDKAGYFVRVSGKGGKFVP